jgi:hypothetical protein
LEGFVEGEGDLPGLFDRMVDSEEGSRSSTGGEGVGLLEETWVMVGETASIRVVSGLLPPHRAAHKAQNRMNFIGSRDGIGRGA